MQNTNNDKSDKSYTLLIYLTYQNQFLQKYKFFYIVIIFILHTNTHRRKLEDKIYHLLQKHF